MARDQYERIEGGRLVDRYGRTQYVLRALHAAPAATDLPGGGTYLDADGREQIVLRAADGTVITSAGGGGSSIDLDENLVVRPDDVSDSTTAGRVAIGQVGPADESGIEFGGPDDGTNFGLQLYGTIDGLEVVNPLVWNADEVVRLHAGGGPGISFVSNGNTVSLNPDNSGNLQVQAGGLTGVQIDGKMTVNDDLTLQSGLFHAGASLTFFNGSAATKQTVTGSRGGNAALASLLTALATYGLITNSSSA